ncbi:hypothetical protein [Microvirga tunisiensis]|uniref:Core-binding (CB) domain-containing protein n=1 Tax=Microvirga tunisiensis TaxID=2108360 RepID=A0A5N7MVJ3_9HYPH|nr:hypothetical protein [Microvirga tunisiensis]MPR13072.1 hypothetical protein [Microvirga tunisiensis]MPR30961.1 hypothetical protein [Microvirga tunisiensis]
MPSAPTLERKFSPDWAIDRNQLAIPNKFVIPDHVQRNTSRVGDDVWDLRCTIARVNSFEHRARFDFRTIDSEGEREFIREYLYLCLNFDHLGSCRWQLQGLTPDAACSNSPMIRYFLRCVHNTGRTLYDINQNWLDQWLQEHRHLSASSLVHRISMIRRLFTYEPEMSFQSLQIAPWGMRSATKIAGYRLNTENKTNRVPEAIYAPTLRWAMFMVERGVDDLVRFRNNVKSTGVNASSLPPGATVKSALDAYLSRLRQQHRKVPLVEGGGPSRSAIARETGISWSSLKSVHCEGVIDDAIQELGGELEGQSFGWSNLPDTVIPWRSSTTTKEAFFLLGQALGACYLVVGLLSGMRDSEVTALRRGCVKIVKNAHGQVHRYEIEGYIFKGSRKKGFSRQKHTWITIKPVADAIIAAEKIQDHLCGVRNVPLGEEERDLIFARPALREGNSAAMKGGQSNTFINSFANACTEQLEEVCARATDAQIGQIRALYSIPPTTQGTQWRWQSRQLRRTLAWFIANQPFGVIAGMLQYGQASELMFEGYAGTSASGFRDEIEQERQRARLTDIVALYEGWLDGERLGGPMGAKLSSEFDRICEELGELPVIGAKPLAITLRSSGR